MPGPLSPVVMRFGGALSGLTWRRCFSYDHGNDRKLYWAETAICNQATVRPLHHLRFGQGNDS